MTDKIEAERANSISEILEIDPPVEKFLIPEVVTGEVLPEVKDPEKQIKSDHEDTRDKLLDLYSQGSSALDTLIRVAEDSESPRAFEVVSQLLRNLADISEKLLDSHQKVADVKRTQNYGQPVAAGTSIHNQILFTGTTDELQEALEKMTNGTNSRAELPSQSEST